MLQLYKVLFTTLLLSFISFQSFTQHKIYWGDQITQSINHSNLDGSDTEILLTKQQVVRRMQIDADSSLLFWVEGGSGTIWQSNLDFSNMEIVYQTFSPDLNLIEYDPTNNRIFFTISGDGRIRSINLIDGAESTIVANQGNIQGIDYDPINNKLYWSELDLGTIKSAKGNGDQVSIIYQSNTEPFDIKLDLEQERIYFSDRETFYISSINLSGNDKIDHVTNAGNKGVISLDLENQHIYWVNTEFQFISRSNLDGSNITILQQGTTQFSGMDVYIEPTPVVTNNLQAELIKIQTYPNPTDGTFSFEVADEFIGEVQINIYGLNGKEVFSKNVVKNNRNFKEEINLNKNPSGIYFLQIQLGNKWLSNKIVIINDHLTP